MAPLSSSILDAKPTMCLQCCPYLSHPKGRCLYPFALLAKMRNLMGKLCRNYNSLVGSHGTRIFAGTLGATKKGPEQTLSKASCLQARAGVGSKTYAT